MKKFISGYNFCTGNRKSIIEDIFNQINYDSNVMVTCLDTKFFIDYYANPRIIQFYNNYNYLINSSKVIRMFSLLKRLSVRYISINKFILDILCEIQNKNYSVYVYTDESNCSLVSAFFKKEYPNINLLGIATNSQSETDIISSINKKQPDILLIANTNNSQSEFALRKLDSFNCKLILSCGSFFSKKCNKGTFFNDLKFLFKIFSFKYKKMLKKKCKIKGYVAGWFYPPQTTAQAISTLKILKNSKYKYDVFTTKSRAFNYSSETCFDIFDTSNINVFMSDEVEPDLWCKLAAEKFIKNSDQYNFFMTRVMPSWSHDVGLKIRESGNNSKWIASFADPMFNSPYVLYNIAHSNFDIDTANRIVSNYNDIFNNPQKEEYKCFASLIEEKNKILRVFEECNLMIFTNEYQLRWMLGDLYDKYSHKCFVLPHSFDPDFYLFHEKSYSPITRFLFIGHTDAFRNLNNFVKAVHEIIQNDSSFKKKIKVTLIGNIYSETINLIEKFKLAHVFVVEDNIDYLSSLDKMSDNDVLIHSDAKFEFMDGLNVYFASKLSDYLGTEKLIFSLSTRVGPTVDILNETNHIVCEIDDINDIKQNILKVVNGEFKSSKHYNFKYSSDNVVKKYDRRLIKVLKGKK